MLLEESLGSPCNAFLLDESYAFRPTSVRAVFAEPDFCENQCALVHHDQVNFTQTAVKVPLQCFEPAAIQKSFSNLFPFTTLRTPVVHDSRGWQALIFQGCRAPRAEYRPGRMALKVFVVPGTVLARLARETEIRVSAHYFQPGK